MSDTRSRSPIRWMIAGLLAAGIMTGVIIAVSGDPRPDQAGARPEGADPTPAKMTRSETDPGQRTQPPPRLAADAGSATAPETDPVPPVATAATVTINAMPWAEVRLNGRRLGTTPRRNVSIPIGNHTLELENPALNRSARVPLRITTARRVTVLVDLSRDPPSVTIR